MNKDTISILSKVRDLIVNDGDEFNELFDEIYAYYFTFKEVKDYEHKNKIYKSKAHIDNLNMVLNELIYFQEEELDQFIYEFESKRSNIKEFIDTLYYALLDDKNVQLLSEKVLIGYDEFSIRKRVEDTRIMFYLYKSILESYDRDIDYDEGNPCIFMRHFMDDDDDDAAAAATGAEAPACKPTDKEKEEV